MLQLTFPGNSPLNILMLGAHCDDIEIGAGASLLKLAQRNLVASVKWIVLSSTPQRKQEALNSAGAFLHNIPNANIVINEFRDGFLHSFAREIKEYFEEVKAEYKPDVIFTHYLNDRHQDHNLISNLTWNTWRNHLILEYEIPKYDADLGSPNLYMPIEEDILSKKIEIILSAFTSQKNKHWFHPETFRALPRIRGMEIASVYAEAFHARKISV